MSIDSRIRIPDGTDITAQWAGNLLPPIAFLLQLEIAYMLVPRACDAGLVFPIHLAQAGEREQQRTSMGEVNRRNRNGWTGARAKEPLHGDVGRDGERRVRARYSCALAPDLPAASVSVRKGRDACS